MNLDTKDKIIIALYKTCRNLGATSELLSILGSYKDTLEDEEILEYLTHYNNESV
jgi:hypothetical protein